MHDTQECLIAREQSGPPSKRVALEHSLTSMLGENFDDSSVLRAAGDVPLHISTRYFENGAQFIRLQLIWGENSERR